MKAFALLLVFLASVSDLVGTTVLAADSSGVCGTTDSQACVEIKIRDGRRYIRVVNRGSYDVYCNISASNFAYYEFPAYAKSTTRWFVINSAAAAWQWSCG